MNVVGVEIPVGAAQASLRWSVAGDPEFMVATIGFVDITAARSAPVVAAAMGTAWDASTFTTAANIAAGWSAGTILVTVMDATGPLTFEVGTAVGGSGAAGTLPNNCAVLARKFTASGGRRNRGRFYLPPAYFLDTEVNQVGTLDPAVVTEYQGYVDSLLAQMVIQDLGPRLLHSDGGGATPITSIVVQPKLATQRKRMRR